MRFSLVMVWYDTDQNNAKGQVQEAGARTRLRSSRVYVQVVSFQLCFKYLCILEFVFFGEPASLFLDLQCDTGNLPIEEMKLYLYF